MMTGDYPVTAVAIARQAGLDTNAPPMTGQELASLGDAALRESLSATRVF